MDQGSKDVDQGWAWVIMIAATLWNVLVSGTLKTFGLIFLEFQSLFNSTPVETAWMGFTFSFMMLVLSPFAGYLGDRLPARWIAMAAGGVGALGIMLTGFVPTLPWAVITYGGIAGTAAAVIDSPVFGMLNKYFLKRRALANSVAFAGSGVGCLLMPIFLTYTIEVYTVKGAMIILGGVWAHAVIIGAVLRPVGGGVVVRQVSMTELNGEMQVNEEERNEDCMLYSKVEQSGLSKSHVYLGDGYIYTAGGIVPAPDLIQNNLQQNGWLSESLPVFPAAKTDIEKEETISKLLPNDNLSHNDMHKLSVINVQTQPVTAPDNCNLFLDGLRDYWSFLKNTNMLLSIFGIMLGGFAYFNQLFLLPLYAHELGMSKLDGAMLVSIPGMAEIGSRLILGAVADRPCVDKTLLVIVCSVICSILGMIVTLVPSRTFIYAYTALLGVFGGTFIPLGMPITAEFVPLSRISSTTGLFLWAMGMAFALGPPVLGFIKEVSGFYCHAYRACLLVYLPACALFLICWFRKRSNISKPSNKSDSSNTDSSHVGQCCSCVIKICKHQVITNRCSLDNED